MASASGIGSISCGNCADLAGVNRRLQRGDLFFGIRVRPARLQHGKRRSDSDFCRQQQWAARRPGAYEPSSIGTSLFDMGLAATPGATEPLLARPRCTTYGRCGRIYPVKRSLNGHAREISGYLGQRQTGRGTQQNTLGNAGGGRSAILKGFGCRPEHERSIRYKAGVRKPRKKEPAGRR